MKKAKYNIHEIVWGDYERMVKEDKGNVLIKDMIVFDGIRERD